MYPSDGFENVMATDEFSIENPINHYSGKWNRLLPLKKTDPNYSQVEKQFRKGWKHPQKKMPGVHAIFKVLFPEDSLKPYLEYRARVAASPFVNSTKKPGNEHLLFHGTNRFCRLGEDGNSVRLCALPNCLLCSVIRGSFDVAKCGTKNKFRRFGTGIYSSACSSKADDYSFNGTEESPFRVLLVNRVVVGRPLKRSQNAVDMTAPPFGYDSVIGVPGADLNYEETVVYTNDAIRPAYLVVYGNAPEIHSKLDAFISALFSTPLAS